MTAQFNGRPQQMTFADWDRAPWNRWSFQHVREIVPTALVSRGEGPVARLVFDPVDISDWSFEIDGETGSIAHWLDGSETDGFLVLSGDRILVEDYRNGMNRKSTHLVQSVSKSVTAIAAGALVEEGILDPGKLVTDYLPELECTAYRGATLRHVLDMTSGTYFDETYTTPDSHCAFLDAAAGWKPYGAPDWPRTVLDVILGLDHSELPHGDQFRYRSIETDVLAHCMIRASGHSLQELVSRHVWEPMGAESDAYFTVDPSGYAASDGGFNASLRDLGRFGKMIASGGRVDGIEVVPEAWIADCLKGNADVFRGYYRDVLPKGAYRNQFWIEEAGQPVLLCRGVFGQLIYIDMRTRFVAVKLSSWPDFINVKRTRTALAAIRAIRDRISQPE